MPEAGTSDPQGDPPPPAGLRAEAEQVARTLIASRSPDLTPGTGEYDRRLAGYADCYVEFGKDAFELRFGLREPRTPFERLERDFFAGRITEAEFRRRGLVDRDRPIDAELLRRFCEAFLDGVDHYAAGLRKIIAVADAVFPPPPEAVGEAEGEVDRRFAAMTATLPLWREQVRTVTEFLEEVRIAGGSGPSAIGSYRESSAFWLANAVMRTASREWKRHRDIAEVCGEAVGETDRAFGRRDHWLTDDLRERASACHRFREVTLPGLPLPADLDREMRAEFAAARVELNRRIAAAAVTTRDPSNAVEPLPPDPPSGNVATPARPPDGDDRGTDRTHDADRGPYVTINALMLDAYQNDHTRLRWPVRRWAEYLGCSTSTVHAQPAWRTLMTLRAEGKSQRLRPRRARRR